MGLGTCWVSGLFKPEIVRRQIELAENEQVYAVIPVGYTRDRYSMEEKIMVRFVAADKRKSLNELCKGRFREGWPEWIKSALECARLAPSAVNRQPWRFTVNEDAIKVSVVGYGSEESEHLDCE